MIEQKTPKTRQFSRTLFWKQGAAKYINTRSTDLSRDIFVRDSQQVFITKLCWQFKRGKKKEQVFINWKRFCQFFCQTDSSLLLAWNQRRHASHYICYKPFKYDLYLFQLSCEVLPGWEYFSRSSHVQLVSTWSRLPYSRSSVHNIWKVIFQWRNILYIQYLNGDIWMTLDIWIFFIWMVIFEWLPMKEKCYLFDRLNRPI